MQVGLFWLFNTLVPFTDVGTDLFTFLDLLRDGHVMWAILTFSVMWNPFFIHLGVFCFGILKSKLGGGDFEARKRIGSVFTHLPFVLPFKNLYNTAYLGRLRFGGQDFEDRSWVDVEEIQHEAGIAGMYESFTEAGMISTNPCGPILMSLLFCHRSTVCCPAHCDSLHWRDQRCSKVFHSKQSPQPQLGLFPRLFHPTWKG